MFLPRRVLNFPEHRRPRKVFELVFDKVKFSTHLTFTKHFNYRYRQYVLWFRKRRTKRRRMRGRRFKKTLKYYYFKFFLKRYCYKQNFAYGRRGRRIIKRKFRIRPAYRWHQKFRQKYPKALKKSRNYYLTLLSNVAVGIVASSRLYANAGTDSTLAQSSNLKGHTLPIRYETQEPKILRNRKIKPKLVYRNSYGWSKRYLIPLRRNPTRWERRYFDKQTKGWIIGNKIFMRRKNRDNRRPAGHAWWCNRILKKQKGRGIWKLRRKYTRLRKKNIKKIKKSRSVKRRNHRYFRRTRPVNRRRYKHFRFFSLKYNYLFYSYFKTILGYKNLNYLNFVQQAAKGPTRYRLRTIYRVFCWRLDFCCVFFKIVRRLSLARFAIRNGYVWVNWCKITDLKYFLRLGDILSINPWLTRTLLNCYSFSFWCYNKKKKENLYLKMPSNTKLKE